MSLRSLNLYAFSVDLGEPVGFGNILLQDVDGKLRLNSECNIHTLISEMLLATVGVNYLPDSEVYVVECFVGIFDSPDVERRIMVVSGIELPNLQVDFFIPPPCNFYFKSLMIPLTSAIWSAKAVAVAVDLAMKKQDNFNSLLDILEEILKETFSQAVQVEAGFSDRLAVAYEPVRALVTSFPDGSMLQIDKNGEIFLPDYDNFRCFDGNIVSVIGFASFRNSSVGPN